MRRLLMASVCAAALLALGGCSAAKLAGAALGGGPNVAANVQAGRTNAQVVGQALLVDQRLGDGVQARTIEQSAGKTTLRAEAVQSVTVHNEAPPWFWALLILGWILPTPRQIGLGLFNAVSKIWSWRDAN